MLSQAARAAESDLQAAANASDNLCISLRMLAEAARLGSSAGRDLAASATCYGLNFVRGYAIDGANDDIVLYGNRIEGRPPILLDDLCVCVQNVWHPDRFRYVGHQYPHPFCSLDPQKGAMASVEVAMREVESLDLEDDGQRKRTIHRLAEGLGPQEVRVGGIARDVRLAHVMIDADYHMKKVSQGHLTLPGVRSCPHIGLERQRRCPGLLARMGRIIGIKPSSKGSSMSRFWFHLDKKHPTFAEESGVVQIKNCAMVVLTERQVSASDGSLVDGGRDDPVAKAFAKSMSSQLRKGAAGAKAYADLENIYRLVSLLKKIQFDEAEVAVGLELGPLLDIRPQRIEMPDTLPALANIEMEIEETPQTKRWYCSLVCGGVSMDVSITRARFKASRDRRLVKTRESILRSRPNRRSIFWTSRQDS